MTLEDSIHASRLRVLREAARTGNVSATCRRHALSRTVFYRLRRRFEQYGADGVHPTRRHAAVGRPSALSVQTERRVIAFALAWPTSGPQWLSDQLARDGLAIAPVTLWRLLRRHQLGTRRARLAVLEQFSAATQGILTERTARRDRRRTRHVAAAAPGDLLSLDTFYVGKLKGVGKVWQITGCDAACSYAWARLVVGEVTAAAVLAFLRDDVRPTYRRAHWRLCPFGTAAEYTAVPTVQAVPLPENVSFEQGACLGIPTITAHRCVHVAGPVEGRTVLVQGGAGAVGICAVQFARRAGATVIAAVRTGADDATAQDAGAHHVVHIGLDLVQQVHALAPQGVSHIVDVAFGANIAADVDMLDVRGSIATYATNVDTPAIPFWLLLFKNIRIDFLGSDDFAPADKEEAARATNEALLSGWRGMPIVEQFPLDEIASAHEVVESSRLRGRVVVML